MSTAVLSEEESLARALGESPQEQCVRELLPRAFRARTFYKPNSEQIECLLNFERAGEARDFASPWLELHYIQDAILPLILHAEESSKRAHEDNSDYVGVEGKPVTVEATVVYVKDFVSELYGTKWLTILRDDHNNRITYWNTINVFDPVLARVQELESNPGVLPDNRGKRAARKGDKVKFTATVKKHEVYKRVKGTVVQRARKTFLLKAGPAEEQPRAGRGVSGTPFHNDSEGHE